MVFGIGKTNLSDAKKQIEKYGLKIEVAIIRVENGYTLDYNTLSFERIISHVSFDVSETEFNDFVARKTNAIIKRG